MYDVVEVNIREKTVQVMERGKDKENAEAVMKMAVMRRGVDTSFFAVVLEGSYQDGDTWGKPRKQVSA